MGKRQKVAECKKKIKFSHARAREDSAKGICTFNEDSQNSGMEWEVIQVVKNVLPFGEFNGKMYFCMSKTIEDEKTISCN